MEDLNQHTSHTHKSPINLLIQTNRPTNISEPCTFGHGPNYMGLNKNWAVKNGKGIGPNYILFQHLQKNVTVTSHI